MIRFPSIAVPLAAALAVAVAAAPPAKAADLVVDVSKSLVEISTGFVGSDLLLFGAVDGPGDVVVVVRGPTRNEVVRRKEQVLGVWVNRAEVTFRNVPAFYAVSTSRALDEILTPELRTINRIGYSRLVLEPIESDMPESVVGEFRRALIRNKERQRLYDREIGSIRFLGNRLFRSQIAFPSTVSTGNYEVDIYLVRNRKIVRKEMVSLTVQKSGVEAEVYDFAHRRSLVYGILAVIAAVMAGWIANALFRRT